MGQHRFRQISLAVLGCALAWLIFEARGARHELGAITDRQRMALDGAKGILVIMEQTWNITFQCGKKTVTLTCTGTWTECKAAADEAERDCQ